jgi:DNA-binding GntR family transcriptional regulator
MAAVYQKAGVAGGIPPEFPRWAPADQIVIFLTTDGSSVISAYMAAREDSTSDLVELRVGRVAAPLRGQVLDLVRQGILDFRYKPGQRLVERELIEQIGVSRTTVREVLRELEAEGLVKTIPQKGAIVVVPTPEEAAELYEVRSALEQLAVRNFVERASDEQVTQLRQTCDAFGEAVASGGDTRALLGAKDAFYDVLLEGAGNSAVRTILGSLQARVRMLRAASMSNSERGKKVFDEINALVTAVEARDADAAALACARHLGKAEQSGLKGISSFAASV